MLNYRNTLYANYHSTQSGRASLTDARSLFEREILPKDYQCVASGIN